MIDESLLSLPVSSNPDADDLRVWNLEIQTSI